MKWIWIVIIPILIIGLLFAAYLIIESRIRFDFRLDKIDFNRFIGNILKAQVDIKVEVEVINKNSFNIPIKNLYVELYYENQLIANSLNKSELLNIKSDTYSYFGHWMNIRLSKALFKLSKRILAKEDTKVKYIVKGKLWFIPFTITNTFKA